MYQEPHCVVCIAVTSFTSLAWTSGLSRRLHAPSAKETAKQAAAPECLASLVFHVSSVVNIAICRLGAIMAVSLFCHAGGVMLLIQHAAV